jgi:large subunit ribosomal protein L10
VNRDQKAAFIDEVADRVGESEAIFAVDYRGITVAQVAELRTKLGEADATFQVVKNTLTSIALDKAAKPGTIDLKEFLHGPTAFTYIKGDIAMAAKAIADFTKEYERLSFKGGMMEGQIVSVDQFNALTKLPSRDVLNGQLVGMIATPLTGLVRGLGGLIGGLAIQLGAIRDQGLVTGEAPAAPAEAAPAAEEAPAEEATADEAPAAEAPAEAATADEAPADEAATDEAPADEAATDEAPADEAATDEAPAEEAPAEEAPAEEAPADEAPAEAAPGDEATADEAPADEAPADDAPADSADATEAPAEDAPATEEAPEKEEPSE